MNLSSAAAWHLHPLGTSCCWAPPAAGACCCWGVLLLGTYTRWHVLLLLDTTSRQSTAPHAPRPTPHAHANANAHARRQHRAPPVIQAIISFFFHLSVDLFYPIVSNDECSVFTFHAFGDSTMSIRKTTSRLDAEFGGSGRFVFINKSEGVYCLQMNISSC